MVFPYLTPRETVLLDSCSISFDINSISISRFSIISTGGSGSGSGSWYLMNIWHSALTSERYSSANCQLEFGIKPTYKCTRNHTYWGLKITEACNPKMVFKICEGISCSSFYVKEFDVIVHKKYFPCITLSNFEVGTRHSHQTLLSIEITKKLQ